MWFATCSCSVPIPDLHREWELDRIKDFAKQGFDLFRKAKDETLGYTTSQAHYFLEKTQREMEAPLKRLERKLHGPVYLFIMPLFAFINPGIVLDGEMLVQAFHVPSTWGIILGLFVGKPISILLSIWILLTFFYRDMPGTRAIWKLLFGVAFLCGIGFTMSLFIANLSFADGILVEEAKMGILIASLAIGVLGYFVLHRATRDPQAINM